MDGVDEELGAARLWLSSVGHRERVWLVGELLGQLIWDVTTLVAGDGLAVASVGRSTLWAALTCNVRQGMQKARARAYQHGGK